MLDNVLPGGRQIHQRFFSQRWDFLRSKTADSIGQGKTFFAPTPNASIHRKHLGVAHFLKIVGGQSGPKSTATIEHHGRLRIRHTLFDITLDNSFAQMNRARKMIGGVLTFFTHVDEQKLVATVEFRFHVVDRHLVNTLTGVFDDLQKTRGMLMSHGSSIRSIYFSGGTFWRVGTIDLPRRKPR